MKKEFEKYFYRIIDSHFLNSLENWQVEQLKRMSFKLYKKIHKTK